MIWAPFALALFFGLLISATLYFVLVWPSREPGPEDAAGPGSGPGDAAGQGRASQ